MPDKVEVYVHEKKVPTVEVYLHSRSSSKKGAPPAFKRGVRLRDLKRKKSRTSAPISARVSMEEAPPESQGSAPSLSPCVSPFLSQLVDAHQSRVSGVLSPRRDASLDLQLHEAAVKREIKPMVNPPIPIPDFDTFWPGQGGETPMGNQLFKLETLPSAVPLADPPYLEACSGYFEGIPFNSDETSESPSFGVSSPSSDGGFQEEFIVQAMDERGPKLSWMSEEQQLPEASARALYQVETRVSPIMEVSPVAIPVTPRVSYKVDRVPKVTVETPSPVSSVSSPDVPLISNYGEVLGNLPHRPSTIRMGNTRTSYRLIATKPRTSYRGVTPPAVSQTPRTSYRVVSTSYIPPVADTNYHFGTPVVAPAPTKKRRKSRTKAPNRINNPNLPAVYTTTQPPVYTAFQPPLYPYGTDSPNPNPALVDPAPTYWVYGDGQQMNPSPPAKPGKTRRKNRVRKNPTNL